MALEKLLQNGNYRTASLKQIRTEFEAIKQQISTTEKAIISQRGLVNRTRQIGKDFLEAHNPLSQYSEPDKLSIREKSPLAKAMSAQPEKTNVPKAQPTKPLSKDDLNAIKKIKRTRKQYAKTTDQLPRKKPKIVTAKNTGRQL